jgi:hypothetical protein
MHKIQNAAYMGLIYGVNLSGSEPDADTSAEDEINQKADLIDDLDARLLGDSEKTVETVYGKHAPDYLRRAVNSLNLKPKPTLKL